MIYYKCEEGTNPPSLHSTSDKLILTLKMQPALLKPLFHRGGEQLGIFFSKNSELNPVVRKIKGIKWSQTYKCWYLPLNQTSYKIIRETLQSKANLDTACYA